ncbi:MAG: cyclopropane fatty acyl phospholipid synthase [Gammaproteobacteria bacterium]|nr:cyclopropane fatty acyl phospholipid synthase [Gammaproteobacteria bacterium]MCW8928316.1 cyclopropane fatty acyl phospholipid synthase [Gammaproteobacteria bacterium]MCW8972476.1 cyclopropane fatty acyl phospholipid synthase [Gammaproteobacteria bacterium]MCW8992174.1 cyclopropane fatty acyl phospholipid synthase [Gammaproteobacteria bacterium]
MKHDNATTLHRFTEPSSAPPTPPALLKELLTGTGVSFNGSSPWDIQIRDPKTYRLILSKGSLGFGEAYMDGHWEAERLDELFYRLLSHGIDEKVRGLNHWRIFAEVLRNTLMNPQCYRRAFQVGEQHYDTGNDIFEAMLDSSMSYSCGYWAEAQDLEKAQFNKLDLICRKLELQPGERVLDIGCGWGGMARHAAEHYGVEVTGITVSREQQKLARERCKGLPVDIELMDYRDLTGSYDKIVSVGMFEHVGLKNYPVYFDTVQRLLKDNGLFLLHTIGTYSSTNNTDPWIEKYIFPNGKLPSARQLSCAVEGRYVIEDWHNFGPDYDRTLMAWWDNFDAAWPDLQGKYDERFYRMWKYYLMCCAGMFRAKEGQLWQLVLSKQQRQGTYRSVR